MDQGLFAGLRSIVRIMALGAFILVTGSGVASAQQPTPEAKWDLTPFLGAAFGEDIKTTTTLGVAVAYRANTRLAFEGELSFLPDIAGDTSSIDSSVLSFAANGLYFVPFAFFEPYAAVGIGFSRFSTEFTGDGTNDESHTEFAFNLGGGVRKKLSARTSVRGDLRYFNVNDENPNFWRLYGGVSFHLGR